MRTAPAPLSDRPGPDETVSKKAPPPLVEGVARLRRRIDAGGLRLIPERDQFFLFDPETLWKIVRVANIEPGDAVLEIGAGYGGLSLALAIQGSRVTAIELDARFDELLRSLPGRIDAQITDGLGYMRRHITPSMASGMKLVANPPYSLAEPLMHELIRLPFTRTVLTIPSRLVRSINRSAVLSAFFSAEAVLHLPPSSFVPRPRTPSDVTVVHRRSEISCASVALRQYVYRHSTQLLRNALREAIIRYANTAHGLVLTKNEAREIVSSFAVSQEVLESPARYAPATYASIAANGERVERILASG